MRNRIKVISIRTLALSAFFISATGLPQEKQMQRIIGGSRASVSDVPFIASIFPVELAFAFPHICGGSVISARHVLSAAHCFTLFAQSSPYGVRLGSEFDFQGGIVISVESVMLHPDYNKTSYASSDIAIIKLTENIPLGDKFGINVAVLPSVEVVSNQMLTVFGWGFVKPNGTPVHCLRKVNIPVVDWDICRQRYQNVEIVVRPDMFCAGYLDINNVGPCHTDSGGPIVADGVLYGIVSLRSGECADSRYPTVFTSVINFVPWIMSNINEH